MSEITADLNTLFDQAPMTALEYMIHAKKNIDTLFGEGYAASHPALVAGFIRTCAADFTCGVFTKLVCAAIDRHAEVLSDTLIGMGEGKQLHEVMAEHAEDIKHALNGVTGAIRDHL